MPHAFDYASFGEKFLDAYLERGMGALSKKEIDLVIFSLLHSTGAITLDRGLQDISVKLRMPVARVRSIVYEMQLREHVVSPSWFREKLLAAVRSVKLRSLPGNKERIEFGVENPMLRTEIEGALKAKGHFPDFGVSREIMHIDLNDFATLIGNVLGDEEKRAIVNSFRKSERSKSQDEKQLLQESIREFVLGVAREAGGELGRTGVILTLDVLSGGASAIERLASRFFSNTD